MLRERARTCEGRARQRLATTDAMTSKAALGLGLAALGRPGYMTVHHAQDVADPSHAALEARCHAVLDAAWAAGVRHVDVARSYGDGEAFLAAWLAARRPGGLFVSSKWGYRYTAGWQQQAPVHEVKDHGVAHLRAQWPQSQRLLGGALSLYQIHSATLESGVLDDAAVLDELHRLRVAHGVAVGLSVSGPRQADVIRRALAVRRDGAPLFTWVQATWNVLEPSAAPALAEAKAQGARVIVKEALANGRLTDRGDVPALRDAARALGATADALALAAALAQPFADVVLSGAVTLAQLESNLRAPQHVAAAAALPPLALPPGAYWAQRAQLAWT